MRIVRILGVLVFLLMMSHPIFAGCNTTCSPNEWGWWDCHQLSPPNEGCRFEVDGCSSTGMGCLMREERWTVASVEIRRMPGDRTTTAVAVAAVEPSTKPHSSTQTTDTR
ncbi:MAG: hypothetical protein JWO56_2428 [Acidobacteria bacterium]|nr:hypothetical protein [Acidobacteriota bacterium]